MDSVVDVVFEAIDPRIKGGVIGVHRDRGEGGQARSTSHSVVVSTWEHKTFGASTVIRLVSDLSHEWPCNESRV